MDLECEDVPEFQEESSSASSLLNPDLVNQDQESVTGNDGSTNMMAESKSPRKDSKAASKLCCAPDCNKQKRHTKVRSDSEGSSDEESVSKRNKPRSFHKLPLEPTRRQLWLDMMFIPDPGKLSVICSDHFQEKDMDRTGQVIRIRDDAYPTRFKSLARKRAKKEDVSVTSVTGVVNRATQDSSSTDNDSTSNSSTAVHIKDEPMEELPPDSGVHIYSGEEKDYPELKKELEADVTKLYMEPQDKELFAPMNTTDNLDSSSRLNYNQLYERYLQTYNELSQEREETKRLQSHFDDNQKTQDELKKKQRVERDKLLSVLDQMSSKLNVANLACDRFRAEVDKLKQCLDKVCRVCEEQYQTVEGLGKQVFQLMRELKEVKQERNVLFGGDTYSRMVTGEEDIIRSFYALQKQNQSLTAIALDFTQRQVLKASQPTIQEPPQDSDNDTINDGEETGADNLDEVNQGGHQDSTKSSKSDNDQCVMVLNKPDGQCMMVLENPNGDSQEADLDTRPDNGQRLETPATATQKREFDRTIEGSKRSIEKAKKRMKMADVSDNDSISKPAQDNFDDNNSSTSCPVCQEKFLNFEMMKSHLAEHLYYDAVKNQIMLLADSLEKTDKNGKHSLLNEHNSKNNQMSHVNNLGLKVKQEPIDSADGACDKQRVTNGQNVSSNSNNLLVRLDIPFCTSLVSSSDFNYSCHACSLKFMTKTLLDSHRINKHETENNLYDEKTQVLNNSVSKRKSCPQKIAKCQICGKCFKDSSLLQSHILTHAMQTDTPAPPPPAPVRKTHVCDECGHVFLSSSHLETHMLKHAASYKCEICPLKFNSSLERDKHKIQHQVVKTHACEYCAAKFHHLKDLKVHVYKEHHQKQIEAEEMSVNEIKIMKYAHKKGAHQCKYCGKVYCSKPVLARHLKWHEEGKGVSCEVCNKKFVHPSSLTLHRRIHTGNPEFECDICHKKFYQKGNLITHMKKHTGDKPFLCQICGLGFAQQAERDDHEKRHVKLPTTNVVSANDDEMLLPVYFPTTQASSNQ